MTVRSADTGWQPATRIISRALPSRSSPPILEGRIGIGEVLDVAQRGGAQHRVRERMTDDVPVGMAGETVLRLESDPAEHQRAAGRERVNVETETHELFTHLASASARRMSSGVVIFRLVRSPSIARTR